MRPPRIRDSPPLRRASVGAAFLLISLPVLLPAQEEGRAVLRGSVMEEGTRRPINLVEVRLLDPESQVVTAGLSDSTGVFRLEVAEPGAYNLAARRVGYATVLSEPLELPRGEEVEIEILMDPRAVPLEAVTVVTRRRFVPLRIQEFRDRAEMSQRLGRGRVYMRADLERLRPYSAQQLFDAVPWGIGCRPLVLVDGLPSGEDLHTLRPEDLEGIELYRGVNQIPPEYYRFGMCGLAMVWRRHDPEGMRPLTWARAIAAGLFLGLMAVLMR